MEGVFTVQYRYVQRANSRKGSDNTEHLYRLISYCRCHTSARITFYLTVYCLLSLFYQVPLFRILSFSINNLKLGIFRIFMVLLLHPLPEHSLNLIFLLPSRLYMIPDIRGSVSSLNRSRHRSFPHRSSVNFGHCFQSGGDFLF